MRMKNYEQKDGKRVWLEQTEVQLLLSKLPKRETEQHIGVKLGCKGGTRRAEAAAVTPIDVVRNSNGTYHLRIWSDVEKTGEYRETPIPVELATEINTLANAKGLDPDEAVLDVTPKTLYRWVKRAAERCYAETGDEGWLYVDYHDLRRTWGTHLLEQGVLPSVVMTWGGWTDWETFLRHYLGEFSPEALKRERSKVDYLEGDSSVVNDPQAHLMPVGTTHAHRS
ncbi:site-specific integrase [Natrialbaceae archaeon AArc-T1-2]|uniref:site-specific integrase n=1 Tax=Natrialbaceae archaeon AArc-T1-2 TaxID=3053904 RepID=UPI00255A744D|nr:site-specific integrase [Natrialbaceae archaeon AArc-T1-2]WIV66572.1 site-specific integrase [Natrialbaceae archaeon AArc-T1-2]